MKWVKTGKNISFCTIFLPLGYGLKNDGNVSRVHPIHMFWPWYRQNKWSKKKRGAVPEILRLVYKFFPIKKKIIEVIFVQFKKKF